jgi:hypothetical protein
MSISASPKEEGIMTIGRGATQMKKQKYLGVGLGLLLIGISGSGQAQTVYNGIESIIGWAAS